MAFDANGLLGDLKKALAKRALSAKVDIIWPLTTVGNSRKAVTI